MDWDQSRVLVRDMKDPRRKAGNSHWCELDPLAIDIMKSMLRREEEIFPYHPTVISRAFTQACADLGIDDLHFHDLRHDGISRQFELGKTIPQVSAHKTWNNLRRYTHLAQTGDKYEGWKWLPALTEPMSIPVRMRQRGLCYGEPERSEPRPPQPRPQ
jgi:integrase